MEIKILEIFRVWFDKLSWEIPDGLLSYDNFLWALEKVEMTSSPGYPYLRSFTNNGLLFKITPEGVKDPEQVQLVWGLVKARLQNRDCDHIRLFIKQEAHKLKKIDSGFLRLISSVSVIDQIIDHMIFGPMNDMVVANYHKTPVKVGWSPYGGGSMMIPKVQWQAIDKSKWDWSVTPWLVELELKIRMKLCSNLTPEWEDLAAWRYKCLFGEPTFITSSGYVLKQREPGVMKSGCVNTIVTNSLMQLILHARVCLELDLPITPIYSLGDDTLQRPISDKRYLELLSQFCYVKHSVKANEFAGYRFGNTIEPLYKGKHAFNLLYSKPEFLEQQLDSYQLLYHESIDLDFFEALAKDCNFVMRDREYYDLLFHGPRE